MRALRPARATSRGQSSWTGTRSPFSACLAAVAGSGRVQVYSRLQRVRSLLNRRPMPSELERACQDLSGHSRRRRYLSIYLLPSPLVPFARRRCRRLLTWVPSISLSGGRSSAQLPSDASAWSLGR